MEYFNYTVYIFSAVAVLSVLIFALRTKKFLKTLITSALLGLSILFILHFTSGFTSFNIELTPFTLGVSGIFGLPGVIAITLSKIIFGL